ncbi:MAG: ORF6N domain-containing protein [Elusimicrobia bacterium]|nr:ORF6N domain-containing protein [Elusimicrobiota bacterium]
MRKKKKDGAKALLVRGPLLRTIRGQRVIVDGDLAKLYGVTTKRLNEQVRRNRKKFPGDFVSRLTSKEADLLNWSQNATSSRKHRGHAYLPFIFTEQGAIMTATVLNSSQTVRMTVFVVRAFVRMKSMLSSQDGLAAELSALREELRERLDIHESAINDILKRIVLILDPPPLPPRPAKPPIGFHGPERD